MKTKFSTLIATLILLLGITFLIFLYDLMPEKLDRSIICGWGALDQFYFYYQNLYWITWIIIFPILYWRMIRMDQMINKVMASCQILILILICFNLSLPILNVTYLNIANWIILGLSLGISYGKIKFRLTPEKQNEDVLDHIL